MMVADGGDDWVTGEIGDPTEFYSGLMKEITPEKADSLQRAIDKHGIRFCVDQTEERIFFTSDPDTGLITVGLIGSTRLMAHAFAYTSAHAAQLVKMACEETGRPLPGDYQERMDCASKLLTWAVTEDVRHSLRSFERSLVPRFLPENLVGLVEGCLPNEFQDLAGQLFANALVWVLYHEVAHIQMGHSACEGLESLEQEKQADRMAAEWMLDSENLTPQVSWKRQVGVATALMWLTARIVYIGPGTMRTHPAAHDRLYQVLDHILQPEHRDVWFFVATMLRLHVLNNKRLVIDKQRLGDDFKENANYLIDILSKAGRG
jgi:hypothetical protein